MNLRMSKILLTGSNGFLGKHIYDFMSKSSEIITLSRKKCDIKVDLSLEIPNLSIVDLVIHCAGKAHSVPNNKFENNEFYNVNVRGTKNLLKALEKVGVPKQFIFISSVSVYGLETGININEDYRLLATDAYGRSKIEAEKIIQNWCKEKDVICTILRLPLLVGKNPLGNLGKMLNAIQKGYYFNIGNGEARKSMILAEDVAKFLQIVAPIGGTYNLTDGINTSFEELSSSIAFSKNKKKPLKIPLSIAKVVGYFGDVFGAKMPLDSLKIKKMTSDLIFDDSKARIFLNFESQSVVKFIKENGI